MYVYMYDYVCDAVSKYDVGLESFIEYILSTFWLDVLTVTERLFMFGFVV